MTRKKINLKQNSDYIFFNFKKKWIFFHYKYKKNVQICNFDWNRYKVYKFALTF